MGERPRVLILTASCGSGHARAAGVSADQIRRAGALPTVVGLVLGGQRLALERAS